MHHSRNTESKQWDETWVMTISGYSRVIRTFFRVLADESFFDKNWKIMFEEFIKCVEYHSTEVVNVNTLFSFFFYFKNSPIFLDMYLISHLFSAGFI
jgi:hypothetical protein